MTAEAQRKFDIRAKNCASASMNIRLSDQVDLGDFKDTYSHSLSVMLHVAIGNRKIDCQG